MAPVGVHHNDKGKLIVGLNIYEDSAEAEGCNAGFWWEVATGKFDHGMAFENCAGNYIPHMGYEDKNVYLTSNGRYVVKYSGTSPPRDVLYSDRDKPEHKGKRGVTITGDGQDLFSGTRAKVDWVCASWSREEHRTLVVGISGGPPGIASRRYDVLDHIQNNSHPPIIPHGGEPSSIIIGN